MLWKQKKQEKMDFDRELLRPVIQVSICTGEQTAGFQNRKTGKFTEIQLIRDPEDLQAFMDRYSLEKIPEKEY